MCELLAADTVRTATDTGKEDIVVETVRLTSLVRCAG
jgi:hypothetical protein